MHPNAQRHQLLACATFLLLLLTTLGTEDPDPENKVRIQDRIAPLYSSHKDVLHFDMYLSRESQTAVDFKKSLDFSSISSNFSTNSDYIEPPGVVGRHQGKSVFFPDQSFDVLKIATSLEGMVFLHKDQRTFTRMVYDRDRGLLQKEFIINEYVQQREYLLCRDVDDVKMYMFYLCFKKHQIENYIIGRKVDYQIIIQNTASNQIVKNLSFFETWVQGLEMNAVHMKSINNRILIMLFNQQTPKMGKGASMKFKSNPRVIFIWLACDFEGNTEDFKILNTKIMNLENELIGTNKDNFEIKWIKVKKNQNLFIQYRMLNEDYSMVNYLKMCKLEIPENFNLSSLSKCKDIYPQAEIYFFDNHSTIITMADINNRIYFCTLNRKKFSIENCRHFQPNQEWDLKTIMLKRNVAIVHMVVDKASMLFLYYYKEEIMTWIDFPEREKTDKYIRDLKNDQTHYLMEFGRNGIQLFDLAFRTFYTIDGKKIQDARTIEIYLEGQLINQTKVLPYQNGDIVDSFQGRTIRVVRDPTTKAIFTNLGFSGSNLNYHFNDMCTVFSFTKFFLNINVLQTYNAVLRKHRDFSSLPSYKFTDLLLDVSKFYILTDDKMYSGQLFLDFLEMKIEDFNMQTVDVPASYNLDMGRMIKRMQVGNEILYFMKQPFEMVAYTITTGSFTKYEGFERMNQEGIHNCKLSERLIYCNQLDSKMFPQVVIFEIKMHYIEEKRALNAELEEKMEEYRDFKLGDEHWIRVEVILLANKTTNMYRFHYVFNLVFLESMVTRGVHFLTDFSSSKENVDASARLVSFFPHKVLDFSNLIRPNSKVYTVSGLYIILQTKPKFEMMLTNERVTMSMPYFDTNQILLEYINEEAKIFMFVYKNLEDGKVYMVLLNITQLQEQQVIRHEEMKHYSDSMKVNMMRTSEFALVIIIYDYQLRISYKTYVYQSTATLIASVTDKVVINGVQIPLFFEEDESVVQNNFLILKPLTFELADFAKDILTISLKKFIDIRGHVAYLDMPDDHGLGDLKKNIHFRDFIYPLGLILSIGNYQEEKRLTLRTNFTKNRLIGNFENTTEFKVFLKTGRKSHHTIAFDLGHEGRHCQLVTTSEVHFFCFYNEFNKSFVVAKKITGSEDVLFKVEIQSLGEFFEVLMDNQNNLIFGTVLRHRRALRIDYIDKTNLRYDFLVIDSYDFNIPDMMFVSTFMYLEPLSLVLTVIVYSSVTNELCTYSGSVEYENDFSINKMATLRENFDMDPIDVNILQIKCNSLINDMEFECVLLGRNFLHEVHLMKTFRQGISIFSWKVVHLFSYTNVFFTEMSLGYSEYDIQYGPKHLIVIILSPDTTNPGRIALYLRFKSRYCLDHEDFGGYSFFDRLLAVNFDPLKKIILAIGYKEKKIIRRMYGVQKFLIQINNPHLFAGMKIPFQFVFTNGKNFRLDFALEDSSIGIKESDYNREVVFLVLIISTFLFFILIFIFLVLTVMAARVKERLRTELDEHDGLHSDIVSDSSLLNLFRKENVHTDFR